MTAQEALKRNEKAQGLKVWQVDDTWFYVESEDGKIAYKCCISDKGDYCNCGDFATRGKNDPQFKCKHILAVMNSIPRNEVLEAQFLDKRKPKLDERFIKNIDRKDFALYEVPRRIPRSVNGDECGAGARGTQSPSFKFFRCPALWAG